MVIYVIAEYYWDKSAAIIFYPWFIANIILIVFRVFMVRLFYRYKPEQTIMKWGYTYLISSVVSGALWGYVALFMLDTTDVMAVVLVVIMLTGMVAGSMVPLAYFPPTHALFTLLTLTPLAYVILSADNKVMLTVGFVLVIYTVVMLVFTFLVSKSVINSILLRFENIALLDNLREQKILAEKASVDKSRFLAATSHDLRQPLHALDLYLGALKNNLQEEENISLLSKSQNSSQSLSQLLSTLMDVSNLDAGNIKAEIKSFDLSLLIERLMDEFYPVADEKNIVLSNYVSSMYVKSDEVLLGRIVRNLISNAIKHNQQCSIDINAEREADAVVLCVTDSGKGIAREELGNIFSEFYQLDNPERDRNKGLGLGLAIVSRLSELLTHHVTVSSDVGLGSCFCIRLPVSDVVDEVSASQEQQMQRELLQGLFVVCIDDEEEVRDALRMMLKSWGCEVLAVDSESSALNEFKQYQYSAPDFILSDYRLREKKTGIDAVVAIRNFFKKNISAYLITGDTSPDIVNHANDESIRTFFKPLDSEKLFNELAKQVEKN